MNTQLVILRAVALVFLASLSPSQVTAQTGAAFVATGYELTSWRPGDEIFYVNGCHTEESALALAQLVSEEELDTFLSDSDDCFTASRPIPARLEEWVDGPYRGEGYGGHSTSIWRIKDLLDDEEYILLRDASGPHRRVRQYQS